MENCSKEKNKKYLRKNICVVCGKEFMASGKCKYCSPECKSHQKERNTHTIVCKNCGKTVDVYKNAKFCSEDCRYYYRNRQAALKKQTKRNEELNGIENVDYVVCQICGVKAKQLGSAHLTVFHNMNLSKYKQLYPDAKITSEIFIKNFSGSNNPNSIENTTEQERKERSPFCEEFYKKRGINPSQRDALIENVTKNRNYNTRLSYYVNKGYDINQAKEKLHERQKTFTLEKCILKYGEVEGKIRFEERQRKWAEKMKEKYNNGEYSKLSYSLLSNAYSNFEIICIDSIVKTLNLSESDYWAANNTVNKQFEIFIKGLHKRFRYDFRYKNKIIEFNGDYWHCNPEKFEANYFNTQIKMTASEKWQYDKIKIAIAKENGYEILVIWESEYKVCPDAVIQKCIDFLST